MLTTQNKITTVYLFIKENTKKQTPMFWLMSDRRQAFQIISQIFKMEIHTQHI